MNYYSNLTCCHAYWCYILAIALCILQRQLQCRCTLWPKSIFAHSVTNFGNHKKKQKLKIQIKNMLATHAGSQAGSQVYSGFAMNQFDNLVETQ